MSHVSTVNVTISDIASLKAACQALGLEFVEGQRNYRWFGRSVGDFPIPEGFTEADMGKCEHAIRIPGNKDAYEVGIARNREGKLVPLFDFWQGGFGLEAAIGKNGSKLKQEYALQVAAKTMLKKGFKVKREFNTVTQKPRLRCSR